MLAVILNHIWNPNETFIRRHAEQLLPQQTVLIALAVRNDCHTNLPLLIIEPSRRTLVSRARERILLLPLARCFPWRATLDRRTRDRMAAFLGHHKVSVILAQYLDSPLIFLPLARELGIRFFAHAHGYDMSRSFRDPYWRRRYVEYNQAEGVIVVSESMKQRLATVGVVADKIHVIPYGVDVPVLLQARLASSLTKIVAVGRMTGKKAPLLMLEAFRSACASYPSLKFDFIGDGELLPQAMEFVQCHGLGGKVTLHGHQEPSVVRRFLAEADIFAQHSIVDPLTGDEEGLPVAILEAMAAALPVVSTRHAGIPEAVVDGVTGFLVDEGDVQAMADRIVTLAKDPALRANFGEAGWQRARDCFTWKRERAELLTVLGLEP